MLGVGVYARFRTQNAAQFKIVVNILECWFKSKQILETVSQIVQPFPSIPKIDLGFKT